MKLRAFAYIPLLVAPMRIRNRKKFDGTWLLARTAAVQRISDASSFYPALSEDAASVKELYAVIDTVNFIKFDKMLKFGVIFDILKKAPGQTDKSKANTIEMLSAFVAPMLCTPTNMPQAPAAMVLKKYLNDNPSKSQGRAQVFVQEALADAFTCHK